MLLEDPLNPKIPDNFYSNHRLAVVLSTLFGNSAYLGVSFFFVLSGFVLTWSTREDVGVLAFWRRRLCKLFPTNIVTWVVAMVLFAAATTPRDAWLPSLLLVQSWFPVPGIFTAVNPQAWSLCSELLFYMLFPLLILGIRRIPERRLWPAAGAAVAGVLAICLITIFLLPNSPRIPGLALSFPRQWFSYTFPPARMFEFLLGMVLARIVRSGQWPHLGKVPVIALMILGYVATIVAPAPFDFSFTAIIPMGVVICTAATTDLRGVRTFLSTRIMQWLGNISFGFYMSQAILIFYGRPKLAGTGTYGVLAATGLELTLFLLTLLAGWLLYSCVEQPVMRRWSRSKKRITPPVPTPETS